MLPTARQSPIKEGRRILGDKTPNAYLSPARNRSVDAFSATSPVKRSLFENLSPKKLLPSPCLVGQKRTIDQVDDDCRVNNASVQARRVEQRTETDHQRNVQEARTQIPVQHDRLQQQQQQQKQSNAMPSNDTPHTQSQQPLPPKPRQLSLNDIVNFIDTPSPKKAPAVHYPRSVPEDPSTRKLFIQEKATLLRSRIQSAMRHVRDHQFDRRLSELEAHSRKLPRLSLPAVQPRPQPHATPRLQKQDTTTHTITTTEPSSPADKTPRRLEPALDLEPTSDTPSNPAPPPGLSSPPLSAGTGNQEDPMRTPTQRSFRHRTNTLDSPMQLSSPPATVSRGKRTLDLTGESDKHETGSVATPSHKGDAVDGLLKLMNTADQCDQPEA
ncbi:uncharacterized protein ACLA_038800 [Aspergillus clavatus NRRL 1]|uniref:Uncharacterized protein n=1 Tax=Aspergillus clavatus (strain ATCC 1007 / CBS 513.65 / DSM 816 / NCTC 3887 / NRRL 1 / QM 1276 / 107) TaxID=344612 RepID=A1CKJ1_ASPCL|nr:uncharacterized protein ACLA_038800 [Aspergillus clavatus NRRL 1]EAW09665.1 hypothetical protein ACLA_038800 [Aspergillus clavatus NRRL 1]